ncbi:MAG TPA: chemotaxis protein CheW [Candidatus Eisenbacteria bacterium]|nr:chemotaxis protein CheW [Candidatus Eisenbacteria bacterium]
MRREAGTALGTRGVLVFPVGEILLGAPVEEVSGLIEGEHITPLPRQSGPAAGVLAFRGSMIPALDLCAYLDVPMSGNLKYGIVLMRGVERFALLVPTLPRLVPGRDLKPAQHDADPELADFVSSIYRAGSDQIHCLRYWSIFDSVIPPAPPRAVRTVAASAPRRMGDVA